MTPWKRHRAKISRDFRLRSFFRSFANYDAIKTSAFFADATHVAGASTPQQCQYFAVRAPRVLAACTLFRRKLRGIPAVEMRPGARRVDGTATGRGDSASRNARKSGYLKGGSRRRCNAGAYRRHRHRHRLHTPMNVGRIAVAWVEKG